MIESIRVLLRRSPSQSTRLSLLASLVSFVLLSFSSNLAAHDGVLFGQQPLVNSGEFLGGGTSYGLVLVEEGEALWTCDEVLEATPYVWRSLSSGALLAGTDEGLRRSSDGGCSWEVVEGSPGQLPIFSLTAHPSAPGRLLITTGSADQENHVFESLDEGQTWSSIFSMPEAALWRALWMADGESLFVEAVGQDGVPLIYASLDGGTTWTDSPYSLGEWRSVGLFGFSADESNIWFSGLSPEGAFALGTIPVSLDSTPQLLAIFPQPVTAFAEHEGLLHIVVGFSEYLLWSGVAQEDMQSVDAGVTACLQKLDGQLWGCGGEPMHSSFTKLGASGEWEGLLSLDEITPRVCPEDSPAREICPPIWESVQAALTMPMGDDDDDDDSAEEPEPTCEGCSAAFGGGGVSVRVLLGLLVLLGGLWGRRGGPGRVRA